MFMFFSVCFSFICLDLSTLMFLVCKLYVWWILWSKWILIHVCFLHCILLAFVSSFSHPKHTFIALPSTLSKSISMAWWYIQPVSWLVKAFFHCSSHQLIWQACLTRSMPLSTDVTPQNCLFHNDQLTSTNSKLLREMKKLRRHRSCGWQLLITLNYTQKGYWY